jgi:hypothetical protein
MMVPDHRAGTSLRCAKCGVEVQVPGQPGTRNALDIKPRVLIPEIAQAEARRSDSREHEIVDDQSPRIAGHVVDTSAQARPVRTKVAVPVVKQANPATPEPLVTPDIIPPKVSKTPEIPPVSTLATALADADVLLAVELGRTPLSANLPSAEASAVDAALLDTDELVDSPTKPQPLQPAATLIGQTLVESVPAGPVELPPGNEVGAHASASPTVESPVLAQSDQEPDGILGGVSGTQATRLQRIVAWQLAAALLSAALLGIGPAIWEISDFLRSDGGEAVRRWAFLLLLLGVVQLGCVALLVQVPDWSSVWVVTMQSLAIAAIYAAVLGLTVITRGDSPLIDALQLNYQYSSGKAAPWSVCMAFTYATLAFFAGRISARWHKTLRQLQAEQAFVAHH